MNDNQKNAFKYAFNNGLISALDKIAGHSQFDATTINLDAGLLLLGAVKNQLDNCVCIEIY